MPSAAYPIHRQVAGLYYLIQSVGSSAENHPLWYMQSCRALPAIDLYLVEKKIDFYKSFLENCLALTAEISDQKFDSVLACPSSQPFPEEIKAILLRGMPNPPQWDLSSWFRKKCGFSSGSGATEEDVYNSITVNENPDFSSIQSLLIIDDILGQGKTIKAVIMRLFEHKLADEAKIHLACPLWIKAE